MPRRNVLETAMTSKLSRRRMLQGSALAGVGAFLTACGGGLGTPTPSTPASSPTGGSSPTPEPSPTPGATPGGALLVANWPAYIDLTGDAAEAGEYSPGSSPSLEAFQKQFGITVDYQEKVGDNNEFFATIEPGLVAGAPTGWDIVVLTDWLAGKIIAKGWAEKIDHANTPTAEKNLRDELRNQAWDPNQDYHYPWQSGMTGIGFNSKALKDLGKPEPKKIADLWTYEPKFVSFLTEARDTFALTLLKLGIEPDPAKVTEADLQKVYDEIKPLVDKGLRFLDNEYLKAFSNKSVHVAMVWSGDLASSGTEGDTFIFPEEGNIIWTDNMLIPKGAANKRNAEAFIDYYYDPGVAAQCAAYIYYVSPVKGVKEAIAEIDDTAPENPLLFPGPDVTSKSKSFQYLPEAVEKKMDELFLDLQGN